MSMNVVQSREYLEQYAFDTTVIQALVVSCFHELIQISVHVFHTDV